jgi:hypothetical protein
MAEKAAQRAQEAWKKGAMGSLAGGGAKARGRGSVCRRNAAGAATTGAAGVGKARGRTETAHRTAVCVDVLGVRRGCDAGAAVVGDWVKRVRGIEIAQVLRAWKGTRVK